MSPFLGPFFFFVNGYQYISCFIELWVKFDNISKSLSKYAGKEKASNISIILFLLWKIQLTFWGILVSDKCQKKCTGYTLAWNFGHHLQNSWREGQEEHFTSTYLNVATWEMWILTFSSIFKDCIKYFHKTFPRVMAVASRLEFSKYSFEGTVGETAELNSSVWMKPSH